MQEEGERIGFKIKVVEKSGTPLSSLLVNPDLSGCLYPDCRVADTGTSHTRSGANYTGTCILCDKRYRGETGFNAHARIDTHEKQIRDSVRGQLHDLAPHGGAPDQEVGPDCLQLPGGEGWGVISVSTDPRYVENCK